MAGEDGGGFIGESGLIEISEKVFRTGDVCRGMEAGGGEGEAIFGCQRSKTVLLRPLVGLEAGELGTDFDELSSWELALTIFWTKPRPWRRLIEGVGSFAGGGLWKAGEGIVFVGITDVWDGKRGSGRMGRARDGVESEDLAGEAGTLKMVGTWRGVFGLSTGDLDGVEDREAVDNTRSL